MKKKKNRKRESKKEKKDALYLIYMTASKTFVSQKRERKRDRDGSKRIIFKRFER
jgi:hypothetical protein